MNKTALFIAALIFCFSLTSFYTVAFTTHIPEVLEEHKVVNGTLTTIIKVEKPMVWPQEAVICWFIFLAVVALMIAALAYKAVEDDY